MTGGQRGTAVLEGSTVWAALRAMRHLARRVEAALAALTRRGSDGAGEDRVTEAAFLESGIRRPMAATASAFERAWVRSSVGVRIAAARSALGRMDPIDRVRAGAWLVLVAAGTALVLRHAAARVAPLTWIVPSVVAMVAMAVLVAAPSVAAAVGPRRTRQPGRT